MSFEPVKLVHPVSGREYTAMSPVDLNDRVNAGYKRVEEKSKPSPAPRAEKQHVTDFSYDAVDVRDGE